MFYILGQKGVLDPGQLRQLRHPGVCAHVEPPADTDTMQIVTVRSKTQCQINDYRLQVEAEGDGVPHCSLVRRFVVDIAFRLAPPYFPLAEG